MSQNAFFCSFYLPRQGNSGKAQYYADMTILCNDFFDSSWSKLRLCASVQSLMSLFVF